MTIKLNQPKMKKQNLIEDNANSGSGDISGDDNNVDEIPSIATGSYVRRRKCNENAPVCEKQKRRDSIRRVCAICYGFFEARN